MFDPLFEGMAAVLAWLYDVTGSYGWAIVLLTLKSTRSMMAMQKFQPEIKRLQQEFKDDKQRLNEEMLAFYRENAAQMGDVTEDGEGTQYKVDFGKGPVLLDLDPGDRAEFLESASPANEFQAFQQAMIGAALKALDLPYSFYDESFTNFYGSRAALLHYVKGAQSKRQDMRELLDRITGWRLSLAVAEGALELPAGWTMGNLSWEWIADGVVWWDPSKDIAADVAALEAGLRTRSEIRKERYGDDWRDVVDALAAENAYAEAAGLTLGAAKPMAPAMPEQQPTPEELIEIEGDT